MSEAFARDALLFAGEMFLLSAVILALAWEAAQGIRNRAALRHLVWAGAFLALVALPVLALVVPSQLHFAWPAAVSEHAMPMSQESADAAPIVVARTTVPTAPAHFALPDIHIDIQTIAMALFALWLAGVVALALRGAAAAVGLRMLKRKSRPYAFPNAEILIGSRYEIRMAKEPNGLGPITWGLFRPVVLLPFNAQFWPRERWHAVLLHETAHIARRDAISQMLSMIACALYWPNPLVWMASRALRNEAEVAADDAVIASGMRPSCYAGELLQLASEFRSREPALAGMPLFMAAPSALEARVKSVLASTHKRSGVTSMDVIRISAIALAATAALTFARPSIAQDEPQSETTVESAPLPAPVTAASPVESTTSVTPVTPAEPTVSPVTPSDQAPPAIHPSIEVRQVDRTVHGHKIHRVWMNVDMHGASPEEIARMQAEVARAEAEVRAAQPEIERAQAEAQTAMRDAQSEVERAQIEIRANEAAMRALREAQPRIEAEVQAALEKARPEIERAMSEAQANHLELKIREHVDKAMKRAQIRIELHDRKHRDEAQDDTTQDDQVQDDEAPEKH